MCGRTVPEAGSSAESSPSNCAIVLLGVRSDHCYVDVTAFEEHMTIDASMKIVGVIAPSKARVLSEK
jgi:hypothetical protein